MLSAEEHTKRLRRFEVDRLIKLVELEALQHHHGHWSLFRFSGHYKVAFDTPEMTGYKKDKSFHQIARMPAFSTMKEALIHALVTGKTFTDYFNGDPEKEWHRYEREADEDFALLRDLEAAMMTGHVILQKFGE